MKVYRVTVGSDEHPGYRGTFYGKAKSVNVAIERAERYANKHEGVDDARAIYAEEIRELVF